MSDLPDEFKFIRRHFRRLAGEAALGLTDDAAIFLPPVGRQIVVAADAMVEGVHFLPDDPPETIGRKLLRCNLSDLAAMDAVPYGYLLTISKPKELGDEWFHSFCDGLAEDQKQFGVSLLGGDTTHTAGPLTLSLTILGTVLPGTALLRSGARAGDELWVTGTIGDGALGLKARLGLIEDPDGYLARRYQLPQPRLGLKIGAIASACMDISDGLLQDVEHIARESCVGVDLELGMIPLSNQAKSAGGTWFDTCISGGDDYELLIAVAPKNVAALKSACAEANVMVTRIGRFTQQGGGVRYLDVEGKQVEKVNRGWSHL